MFSRIIFKRNDPSQLESPSMVSPQSNNRHGDTSSAGRSVRSSWGMTFLGGTTNETYCRTSPKPDLLNLGCRTSSVRLSYNKASDPGFCGTTAHSNNHLRKANSQPSLFGSQRRSMEHHNHAHNHRRQSSKSSQQKKRDDETGFLDRAFENAVSLSFEDDETQNDPTESAVGELGALALKGQGTNT